MSSYEELMSRAAKLQEVYLEGHVPGTYTVGPILQKSGDLILPIYDETGRRIEDLMMAVGEIQVTRCWGREPNQRELLAS